MAIGKNPKCEFVLNHPAILDLHAQVFFSQNTYWIKDLTGSSLVRINNQPVRTQSPLRANDVVALSPEGPAFLFLGEGRLVEATESEEGPTDTGYKITGEVRHESRKKAGQGILDRVRKVFKP
jgi:pSer/pThr/pTyr-binding forkhead associated (FHA) protein